MSTILFDDQLRDRFLPLSFTRPLADFRCGILKISEKWEKALSSPVSHLTQPYLNKKYPTEYSKDNLYINGRYSPDQELVRAISLLGFGEGLKQGEDLIAYRSDQQLALGELKINLAATKYDKATLVLNQVSDIFSKNGSFLEADFQALTTGRKSAPLHSSVHVIGDESMVFMEEGAEAYCSSFNTSSGPIYIGRNAVVMEGSKIRGPFSLGDSSQLKMGAKIYGPTTIGPQSKVGGEVSNSVVFGYSNKAHDGFLGNAVLGEWCNLGADTNNSNLKNNYAEVKLWDYASQRFLNTGLTFCGLIMGDHSKSAINTQFNTGTVVGVSSNIFGAGFPRNFVPSFSWGGAAKMIEYNMRRAFEVAELVYARRNMDFDETEKEILSHVFEMTATFRR